MTMHRFLCIAALFAGLFSAHIVYAQAVDSFSSNDTTPYQPAPAAPQSFADDPFLVQPPPVQNNTSAFESPASPLPFAQKTALEPVIDKERIKQLATSVGSGSPEYLKPLNAWNGPFQNRQRKKNLEQDIIRQVGFQQVAAESIANQPAFDWEKDEKEKGFDWSILDPANFATKVRDWMGMGPDENKAKIEMEKGRAILLVNPRLEDKAKNREAAKHFYEAAKRFPDSLIEEDSLHLAGECYFFSDDYPRAMTMYQKLLMKYQHSKHVDNAVKRLFKIARYWEAVSKRETAALNFSDKTKPHYDTFGFAKKCYETIFINDPNGPISDDAVMALATAYLEKGKYQGDDNYNQAAYYYSYLRENFPLSKHIAKAHENELYARTHAYLGADHPGKTLDEASKLADITLKQFNTELDSEEKQEILGIKESILNNQAKELWEKGQFYDKKKRQYGSAKIYYEQIMEEYPQTPFAEKAGNRMEQIRDLPDVPPVVNLPVNPFKVK
ncbi:hypothetical protein FACS189419_00430 [Planctomycetales bacterium]|nr:hypothetical protein FACS189419_00430 [Planctomycetales bacterium]